jgi:uncharacterized protein YdcH (DUF465 family)
MSSKDNSHFDKIVKSLDPFTFEALKRHGAFIETGTTSKMRKLKRAQAKLDDELRERLKRPIRVAENYDFKLTPIEMTSPSTYSRRRLQLGPYDELLEKVRWEARFNERIAQKYNLPKPNGPVNIPLSNYSTIPSAQSAFPSHPIESNIEKFYFI